MLDRLFRKITRTAAPTRPATGETSTVAVTSTALAAAEREARSSATPPEAAVNATTIRDIVRVEETRDAEFYAGDLFRRRFRSDPPDFPRHYVAFYRHGRTSYLPLGYVHHSAFEDSYLCGGMVIDDRLYRRISAPHRRLIKEAGGIAQFMLTETFALLAHAPAIWGYVGDKQAREVDLRAGFQPTDHPYLMVVWNHDIPEEQKAARMARVLALGPF